MVKRVSRRGFIGAVSAALTAGALAKVAPVVPRRQPGFKCISVHEFVSAEISLDELEQRYLQPAIELLCDRIDREMIRSFVKLPLPRGVEFAAHRTVARKVPVRLITAYSPIHDQMVFRVDCGYYA